MPRRRKLHILRFAFRGKSSVVPLLLLSPPNPLTLGFGGGPFCTASTDSIVLLRLRQIRNTYRITGVVKTWQSGGCLRLAVFLSSAARRGKGISDSAAADVIASNAPLRGGSHTARQNGPKHYPRGFKGIAIPLARLSPPSFVVQRKMGPPEVASCRARPVKTRNKTIAPPGGPTGRRMPIKTQNKKTTPPEGLSKRECP